MDVKIRLGVACCWLRHVSSFVSRKLVSATTSGLLDLPLEFLDRVLMVGTRFLVELDLLVWSGWGVGFGGRLAFSLEEVQPMVPGYDFGEAR